ncbi:TIR domain-containing protein [Lentzea sp. BCCO 10_0856]|uniref:TIR domain-containing protein n=1 Tax=Lentzea miocenica TaxID=3095431 RepID=A0ABU4TAV5_9PSEU|nr:TIR domain-containing protein [Lentzea sp. BCCO 10_0856]MDX8035313.1 TIR domain-containing protein [Lentzea sp. BCCO 10_0856]
MPPSANSSAKKIFGSYSGPALPRMEQILRRLKDKGYDTYIDRQGNRLGDPVSAKIESELQTSTICLVYYSERYGSRHACQFELMQVLSAERRAGGVARTLVINPEVNKEHIHPAVLKDRIFAPDNGSEAALAHIVEEVEARLAQLTGTYQGIDFSTLPRMVGGRPGVTPRVRRYSAMWRLERALHAQRYRLTHQPTNGIAVLTGLRGTGKTSLADDYVMHFAHEYQVVIPVDLAYAAGVTAQSALREAVTDANNKLQTSKGHALVVIDNVPAGVPPDFFTTSFDSPDVLLLIITEHTEYAPLGQEVRLGGLTDDEALELFYRLHRFDRDDATIDQVRQLAAAVNNHAMAVSLLAASATVRRGLTTLTEHVGRVLDGSSDTMTKLSDLFADRLNAVDDDYQRAVLRVLAACGPADVPARQIRHVLAKLGMDESRVVAALDSLQATMLVSAEDGVWHAHGLVRQAVRRHLGAKAVDWLASTYAGDLVDMLRVGRSRHDTRDWKLLVRHARHLVDQPAVAESTVKEMLPLIARELREEGYPASAARLLDRLFASGVSDPRLVIEAASDNYDAGQYEECLALTSKALTSGSTRANVLLSCVCAAALDALGRFTEAEPYWRRAVEPSDPDVLAESERVKVRLRWIRGQRLRGILKENLSELENVRAAATRLPEALGLLALIELAHIELATDSQDKARAHARQVLDHYQNKGQQHHAAAIEAEYVLATAQLRLQFTELKATPNRWAEAEATLRRLAGKLEAELGARNLDVLACKVNIDFALISQGEAKKALASTSALLPVLLGKLDEHHPIVLREYYVHGLAHQQLRDFDKGVEVLGRAHRGQLAALGIAHPETLQTQFEFAMALKLRDRDGDSKRANALVDEVAERAKLITGWRNDLPWQAFTAATLARYFPAAGLRWAHWLNHKHKW